MELPRRRRAWAPRRRRAWAPRAAGVVAAVALATSLTGCARANQAQGAGQQVSFCPGYQAYDALTQPSAADPKAVVAYAEGVVTVIDRIDTTRKAGDSAVPHSVVEDLDTIRDTVGSFGRSYARASGAGRQAAVVAFTANARYADADEAVGKFYASSCLFTSNGSGA